MGDLDPDTDPLVTEPVIHLLSSADTLPEIPSLADHILLASVAIAGRARCPGGRPRGPAPADPLAPGSLARMIRDRLRDAGPAGMSGPDLWVWMLRTFTGGGFVRSQMYSALSRLAEMGLISNLPARGTTRHYVIARGGE